MKWEKRGKIYAVSGDREWSRTHAQVPLVGGIDGELLRIYFGTRDTHNRTVTTFVDVDVDDPRRVLYEHDRPSLGLGDLGCFDDSGAMPSWLVERDGVKYLYYIGWNQGVTVGYRNSIGLAVSEDGGRRFERVYKGPIVDRTKDEPHFCAAPCVLVENGLWRMWYLSCVKWVVYKDRPEPYYHIKYAESDDGIVWRRPGTVCIDFKSDDEAGIVRSSVLRRDGSYRMWYSHRNIHDYRTNRRHSYRIGYAESEDGIRWKRKDEQVGIDVSDTGWDSEMIAYPYVYEHRGATYMLYNGNGFGRSGFGYAKLV